jgi:hypothetical protein
MRVVVSVLIALSTALVVARGGQDADAAKDKLEKAKEAYQEARAKNREYVVDLLNKQEEKARKSGNAKLVDKVKTSLEEYEKSGILPALPATAKQRLLGARTAMDKAFASAINDYTKQKKDDLAWEVEKEWEVFKMDVSDDPSVVRLLNKNSGKYATISKGASESNVVQNPPTSDLAQRFRAVPAATGGWLYLQTIDGKRLLGTDKGGVRNGTELVVSAPRSGTAAATQHWGLLATATSDGWGKLVNRASGKVVGVRDASRSNGAQLVIWSDIKNDVNLQWRFD